VVGAALLFFAFGWLAVAMHIRGRAERSARRLAADLDLRQHELMRALAERDAAEALREIRERRLRQEQGMAMVGRLAGGLAHVLGNALTSIIGHAELLQNQAGGENLRGPAGHILDNARKAAKLTSQFRAFGQGQILMPERVDLNQALRDLKDLVVPRLEPAIAVDLRCEARHSLVSVDRQGLLTALAALAENAAEAMPEGGRLRLETSDRRIVAAPDGAAPDASAESAEAALPPGDYVELKVADTGGGMTEEIRQHAFEPFFTTKDVSQGAGLGLSMVYGFVRQSGGAAFLRGPEGSGTEISILLPALDNTTPLGRPAAN
jgi:signal transduction histidine kinase